VHGTERLGPAQSFLTLCREVPTDSDYYAFCDQDDVWLPDHLKRGISLLGVEAQGSLGLYFSNYNVVDQNLSFIRRGIVPTRSSLNLCATLTDRSVPGCTMVFTRQLLRLIASAKPEFVRMHDYWTLAVAEASSASIIADSEPTLLYRQHGSNVLGFSGLPLLLRIPRLVRAAVRQPHERSLQAQSFYRAFSTQLTDDKMRLLVYQLGHYRESFSTWFQLLVNPRLRSSSWAKTVLARIAILCRLF